MTVYMTLFNYNYLDYMIQKLLSFYYPLTNYSQLTQNRRKRKEITKLILIGLFYDTNDHYRRFGAKTRLLVETNALEKVKKNAHIK